ncbi:class I SAM-dependent methyltransferase [Mycobacterium sp. smrl_JER01]|uniref:class I SAM-dependent methyltransferase n=1 Tax=Mycobacterium sp. smrl_JER01 TaxID=3402633 RepID=UPI003AC4226C
MTGSPDSAAALSAEWDGRYTDLADQIPDSAPDAVLIQVARQLAPGTALDIGCGLGSDAIWLATQGWNATGLDVSQVALDRAATRAAHHDVSVNWVCSRLEDFDPPEGGFDLVVAHYPALLHSPGWDAQRALLGAVATGGTLLVVHHADVDVEKAKSYGFDPADYLSHDDVVELLGEEWQVTVERRRPREVPAGIEGQHTHDDVVVARRG